MPPFADFLFFGVILYIILPTIVLGLWGKANDRWAAFATIVALLVIFAGDLAVRPQVNVSFWSIVLGYAVYQLALAWTFFRWRSRPFFYVAVGLATLPLAAAKFVPMISESAFGFLGISYVTF